jgi:hypothetical protein
MWRAHDRSRLAVQVFLFGVFLSMLLLEEQLLDNFKISNKGFAH